MLLFASMKKEQLFLFFTAGLIFPATFSFAQKSVALMWNTVQFPVHISEKWQLHNDFSYRFITASGAAYQFTVRSGVRKIINEKWNVASGAALFFTRTSFEKANHEFGTEFRVWQEVINEKKLNGKLSLLNRLRFDERFFASTSARDAYAALRIRYRVALIQTIAEKWKLQLTDEYMEQLSRGTLSFQQNRLGITGIYVFSNSAQFNAGYIWSKLSVSDQHFITCTFIKSFSLQ